MSFLINSDGAGDAGIAKPVFLYLCGAFFYLFEEPPALS